MSVSGDLAIPSSGKRNKFCWYIIAISITPPPPPPPPGEKPFDTIRDLVQDGLITLYMEANDVEDYLQTARRRTLHLTSSISLPPAPPSLVRPLSSSVQEPLFEEAEEEYTPSPPPRSLPPPVPVEPCLPQEARERSSSASSGLSDLDHTHQVRRRPRMYDEVEDVPPASGTTMAQTVSGREHWELQHCLSGCGVCLRGGMEDALCCVLSCLLWFLSNSCCLRAYSIGCKLPASSIPCPGPASKPCSHYPCLLSSCVKCMSSLLLVGLQAATQGKLTLLPLRQTPQLQGMCASPTLSFCRQLK